MIRQNQASSERPVNEPSLTRVLTVGDGDLTLSLSLIRAYGANRLNLTASTLLGSSEKLVDTYSNAREVLKELEDTHHVQVLYGIDATQLHRSSLAQSRETKFDVILFHHPHLGLDSLRIDEQWHARRHSVLLAHYLWSAAQTVLSPTGLVHVCLCGTQSTTWELMRIAERLGLKHIMTQSTKAPLGEWLFASTVTDGAALLRPTLPHYPAPRKYRNGKLGSKHFLGKYGYRHRRTHGDSVEQSGAPMNVEGSQHFVFSVGSSFIASAEDLTRQDHSVSVDTEEISCPVCEMECPSQADLVLHFNCPAVPESTQARNKTGGSVALGQDSRLDSGNSTSVLEVDDDTPEQHHHDETSREFASEEDFQSRILVKVRVPEWHDGARLRWFLRQRSVTPLHLSKKRCGELIKIGRIVIDGAVTYDSSRLVRQGNEILVLESESPHAVCPESTLASSNECRIEIVSSIENTIVAFKPAGMRTCGTFCDDTLEMSVSNQEGRSFTSLSKLDTGCVGLCVLQSEDTPCDVCHSFIVLVHGQVPEEWDGCTFPLALECLRKWGKGGSAQKPTAHETWSDLDDYTYTDHNRSVHDQQQHDTANGHAQGSISIHVIETTETFLSLSTLRIETSCRASGFCSAICYALRKRGHPVVSDRFNKSEYLRLPRPMRNAIKGRLCIGCYKVILRFGENATETVKVDFPDRLSARHWQKTFGT